MAADIHTVEALMNKQLEYKEINQKTGFVELYFKKMVELAVKEPVRIPLPHNLGYIQVIKKRYVSEKDEGSVLSKKHIKPDMEHYRKLGDYEYKLVWVKAEFLVHHRIKASKEVNESIGLDAVKKNIPYLMELVPGDTFVIEKV